MTEKFSFENQFHQEEPETIEVDMGEWEIIESGMIGETTGLGPCFGIILYDTISKKAVVGHFPDPRTDMETLLAEAHKIFSDPKMVRAYVGGGSIMSNAPQDLDETKAIRSFVTEQLIKAGFENPKIDYHTSSDTTDMRIDTRTGEVEYITDSSWGDSENENI